MSDPATIDTAVAPARRTAAAWPWVPVLVIGAAAGVQTVMMCLAGSLRPSAVEATPYLSSQHDAEQRDAQAAWQQAGYAIELANGGQGPQLVLRRPAGSAPPPPLLVLAQRGEGAGYDRTLAWNDPAQPLALPANPAGVWTLTITSNNGPALRHRVRLCW